MPKLLVIDTETGGTDPLQHSILSLGAVIWSDGVSGPQFEVSIRESPLCVTPKALEINHIDLVIHCAEAVSPREAMVKFQAFLHEHLETELGSPERIILVGHNIAFDIGFLKRLCRLADVEFESLFSHRILDTAGILRFMMLANLVPGGVVASSEAFRFFEIPISVAERHTALGDAKATATLLSRLLCLVKSNSLESTTIRRIA